MIFNQLNEYYKPCKILCTICHVFRGGEFDEESMEVFNKLHVKFRLELNNKFYKAYREFAEFKPEYLTSKDIFENYMIAYEFGAFTELRKEIEADLKGLSPEAIEYKSKEEEREVKFKENKNDKS